MTHEVAQPGLAGARREREPALPRCRPAGWPLAPVLLLALVLFVAAGALAWTLA